MKSQLTLLLFSISYTLTAQTNTFPVTGNVGIGTTSPDHLLQVTSSNIPTISIGKINQNTNGISRLYFFSGDGSTANGFNLDYIKSASTDRLAFIDGGGVESLSIVNGGKIGIGTVSPNYKLTVIGDARISNTNSTQTADAWFSYLNGSQANGLFLSTTSQTGLSYSVVGFAETNTGTSAGIYGRGTSTGTGAIAYAGYFNGNLAYTGTLGQASDEKFKEGITDIESSLSKVINLKPKEYSFKKIDGYDFPSGKRPGFLAQELKDVFPELVSSASHLIIDKSNQSKNRTDEYLSVDYISLIPHIVKAIQEQNNLIEEYKKSVTLLQDILLNQRDSISSEVLADIPHITQLFPNPTSALLTIKINNPSNGKAALLIKDKIGVTRLTEAVEIDNTTSISISISELEEGLFFVVLIIDDTTYDIKRFIIAK